MRYLIGASILVRSTRRPHGFVWLAGKFCRAVARPPARQIPERGFRLETAPKSTFGALWALRLLTIPTHFSFLSLFPNLIPYFTIDPRTPFRNGRMIPLMHRLPPHYLIRHLADATAIGPLCVRLFLPTITLFLSWTTCLMTLIYPAILVTLPGASSCSDDCKQIIALR